MKPVARLYLSKKRSYRYKDITVKVAPSVFHPGLFFSSKVLLNYLEKLELNNLRILELGAGSGLISLYCCKKGGRVTASDINKVAISNLQENAALNHCDLTVVESDLFEKIRPDDFDLIIINPPYYPKAIQSEYDLAWFCGENFEYFEILFKQLKFKRESRAIMILSEDCNINQITLIAKRHKKGLYLIFSKIVAGEYNYIYEIRDE